MAKRCSNCKQKKEGVHRVGPIQLCPKCRGVEETPDIRGRNDSFLPPELQQMARDMGIDKSKFTLGGP